ncbi:tyrosine-type recombinase/integrase [Panacagrimonas sp.]|uniref:tyrosine-type recombinase/integrase n=1 Tax=Panacagrimonas sp. TaxID=2480088 RepID=UPI003B515C42
MATIVATDSGKWKAIIRKSGWPPTIKTFRLKRDAEDWARRTEDEMVRGIYIQRAPSERTSVASALDRYFKEVTPTKRPITQKTERQRIEIVKKFFGKYSLAAVTPDLVATYRDQRLAGDIDPKSGNRIPRAANTIRIELALLSNLYTVAIREWGMGLVYNPVKIIRKPTPAPHRHRRLTAAEEKRLFAELDAHSNPMLAWLARIALETGMRSSEITTLTRSQVDLRRRIVRLYDTKNSEPREVPLSDTAVEIFREALANPVRPIDTDLIFFGEPGRHGKRSSYTFHKVWDQAKRRAGIADYHFHDLRHECGSRLAEGGMDARKIAAILGHKDMNMAMVYVNLYGRDLVDEVNQALARRRARTFAA